MPLKDFQSEAIQPVCDGTEKKLVILYIGYRHMPQIRTGRGFILPCQLLPVGVLFILLSSLSSYTFILLGPCMNFHPTLYPGDWHDAFYPNPYLPSW